MATLDGYLVVPLDDDSGTKGRFQTFDGHFALTGPGNMASPEHEPQLTVNEDQTTTTRLALNSYKAGRAVIRIEPSQFGLKKGTST